MPDFWYHPPQQRKAAAPGNSRRDGSRTILHTGKITAIRIFCRGSKKTASAPRTQEDKKREGWQRPTLPGSYPPSTIGAGELNERVRDGTVWTLAAKATNQSCFSTCDTRPSF